MIKFIKSQLNNFGTGVMFLTQLPVVSRLVYFNPKNLAASAPYFGVIGALIGVIGALAFIGGVHLFPVSVAVLIAMLATVIATGGLHEDGLADSADGLAGGFSTETRLHIMKDSRIGVYGAMALWFGLTLKFILLLELVGADWKSCAAALVFGHAAGRCSCAWLISILPYVSMEGSKSSDFFNGTNRPANIIVNGAFLAMLSWFISGFAGLWISLGAAAVMLACGWYFRKKIGGITGDCLGAACQIVELYVYLALVAVK